MRLGMKFRKILQREIARGADFELPEGGLKRKLMRLLIRVERLESPWIKSDIEVDIDLYKRAILKLHTNPAWYFIGDDFLNTEFSNHARSYIMNGIDFPYSGDIKIEASEFGKTFGLDEVCHFRDALVWWWSGGHGRWYI